jgi:hypothetical protein
VNLVSLSNGSFKFRKPDIRLASTDSNGNIQVMVVPCILSIVQQAVFFYSLIEGMYIYSGRAVPFADTDRYLWGI